MGLRLIGGSYLFGRSVLRLGLRLLWYDVINPDNTTHFFSQISYNTTSNPDTRLVVFRCCEPFLLNLETVLQLCISLPVSIRTDYKYIYQPHETSSTSYWYSLTVC